MSLIEETTRRITPAENMDVADDVRARLASLVYSPGSLGRLGDFVMQYALARGAAPSVAPRKSVFVFASSHGVAHEHVSALEPTKTEDMVRSVANGGAAINALCRQYDIEPVLVDVGVDADVSSLPTVLDRKVGRGTRNILKEPAMTREQAIAAIETGITLSDSAARLPFHLLGAGELGVGSTTAASAVIAALVGCPARQVVGPGTGVAGNALAHKVEVVEQALDLHRPDARDPVEVLQRVGGFEIAAVTGFLLGAAAQHVPVVVDGFIAAAAAMAATRLSPNVSPRLFYSHLSSEPGHHFALAMLEGQPILDLGMSLGEGSGAAMGIGVLDSAIRLYLDMEPVAPEVPAVSAER